MTLADLKKFSDDLKKQDQWMPALFIGHGSPMNGIEHNEFSDTWAGVSKMIPLPQVILVVSAHWLTAGTKITAMDFPETIHDFGGFPRALYEVQYPAPGHPALARETALLVQSTNVGLAHDWGLDHGAWTVVRRMYPDATIPVLQLSIDYTKGAAYHYELARELQALRKKGVLIIGSGNMVHNLRLLAFDKIDENFGFDWAAEMNEIFKRKINEHDHKALIGYQNLSPATKLAVPTPDHYFPLLYTLGLRENKEDVYFFNDKLVAGSLTMTSLLVA